MRLFIGIDVPEEVKEKAELIEQEIESIQGSFTFVKKEAMHITLNFIGEVDETKAQAAARALGSISIPKFYISLEGVSYFSPKFIKVIFIGIGRGEKELEGAFSKIGSALSEAGVPYEHDLSFKPHLTIARVKYIKEKAPLLALLDKHKNERFGEFEAESIFLKKSTLTPDGPIYENLSELKL